MDQLHDAQEAGFDSTINVVLPMDKMKLHEASQKIGDFGLVGLYDRSRVGNIRAAMDMFLIGTMAKHPDACDCTPNGMDPRCLAAISLAEAMLQNRGRRRVKKAPEDVYCSVCKRGTVSANGKPLPLRKYKKKPKDKIDKHSYVKRQRNAW